MEMMVRTDKQPPREADLVPQLLGYLVKRKFSELDCSHLIYTLKMLRFLLNGFLQFNGFVLPKLS